MALTQDQYFSKLGSLYLPRSIIATRQNRDTGDWQYEADRLVSHQCWMICTDDPEKKKDNVKPQISFDSIVDINGARCADSNALSDNLTKKIMCITVLTNGFKRDKVGSHSARRIAEYYDWVIRWRNSLNLKTMSKIRIDDFKGYVSHLAFRDITSLVPLINRLDWLVAEAIAGRFRLPTYVVDRFNVSVDWDALAEKLGVTRPALSLSREFRSELADRLDVLAPGQASALAASIVREQENDEESAIRSARSVEALLEPWECLSALSKRRLIDHDPLTFEPFAQKSARKIADEIGRQRARTSTLLPTDFLRLMNAAAIWVLDYGGYILQMAAALERVTALTAHYSEEVEALRQQITAELKQSAPVGLPIIVLCWRRKKGGDALELTVAHAVRLLLTACAILIGEFGARRKNEVLSLREGCLIEEVPGLCELSIYIEKTLRDLDRIPVPALIKIVVNTLETLTAKTRAKTGSQWLFQVMRSGNGIRPNLGFRLDQLLSEFAEINQLPCPEGWNEWALKSHQLRRGFAICYYHGDEVASLDALSRLLRHDDPEQTRIYINEGLVGAIGRLREVISAQKQSDMEKLSEAEKKWFRDAARTLTDLEARGVAFNEVRCEYIAHRLLSIWDHSEAPIGRGALTLQQDLAQMVELASADVRIGPRSNSTESVKRSLLDQIYKYAELHFLEPVPGRANHCICRPNNEDDLSQAKCLIEKKQSSTSWLAVDPVDVDVRPDYAYSSAFICLECTHGVAFNNNQKVLAEIAERLKDANVRAATPAAKVAAKDKYAQFKASLKFAKDASEERN